MDFESILEDLHASPVENLLPKFTSVNLGSLRFALAKVVVSIRILRQGVLMDLHPSVYFFPSIMSDLEQFIFT